MKEQMAAAGWRLSRSHRPASLVLTSASTYHSLGIATAASWSPHLRSPTTICPPLKPAFSSSMRNPVSLCSTAFADSVGHRIKCQLLSWAQVTVHALLITECSCHMTLLCHSSSSYTCSHSLDSAPGHRLFLPPRIPRTFPNIVPTCRTPIHPSISIF